MAGNWPLNDDGRVAGYVVVGSPPVWHTINDHQNEQLWPSKGRSVLVLSPRSIPLACLRGDEWAKGGNAKHEAPLWGNDVLLGSIAN